MTMIEMMQDLERRLREIEERGAKRIAAIEARLPVAIPVATQLTQQQADRMQQASIDADIASGHLVSLASQDVALPDYLLAPTPDYRSELPAEAETCHQTLARVRKVIAEAYALPNRAALREHAWRYLDLIRDEVTEQE